jgi:hypothetical protein
MRLPSGCLILLAGLLGCQPAPMTNTVVALARSRDGKSVALLVDRHLKMARVSDGFFLIVIPTGRSTDQAIAARDIGDSAALVATWASKLRLSWSSNDELLVSCDSCGLRDIDIEKQLNHIGITKIAYRGLSGSNAWTDDPLKAQVYIPPLSDTASRRQLAACGANDPTIDPGGIGPIRVEHTVADIHSLCPAAQRVWELGDEAIPEPAMVVRFGRTVVEVVFADTLRTAKVVRIMVEDSSARLRGHLRTGELLRGFTQVLGPIHVSDIECGLHASFDRVRGISVWLGIPHEVDCAKTTALADSIAKGSLRGVTVGRITVFRPGA